jgi:hypothetical protein
VIAPRTRNATLVVMAGLAALISGCSKADSTPPVATATFAASRARVALGSPVQLTYKFDVLPNAAINGDYTVFVHIVGDDGQMIWTDDHTPPVPTSQWKPGQVIGPYTRERFVPNFPYTGHASVIVGLYKPGPDGSRLTLTSNDPAGRLAARHEYKVGDFEVTPAADNTRIIMMSGWHKPESDPNSPSVEWYWTQKAGVVTFQNPKKDVTLYLESDARPDIFNPPQVVTIQAQGQVVTTFTAGNAFPEIRRIPITAAQLGTADVAEVRIEVDRTFVPAKLPAGAQDTRELGLRVYHVFVEPR